MDELNIEEKQQQQETTWKNDKVFNEYKEGLSYNQSEGYVDQWKECIDFYDGKQWKAPTEQTKNMPRPVFNIIKYIITHKVASILNETVKMVYTSQEIEESAQLENPMDPMGMMMPIDPMQELVKLSMEGADKFTKYSGALWESLEQDRLNEELMYDAAILGTGIIHYYWDNSIKGGVTHKWVGDVRGESLDPMNVFFGNPQEKDVQKQPWIIITSREAQDTARAIAQANNMPLEYIELVQADQEQSAEGYEAAQNEMKSSRNLTVITKYFKQEGLVYFTKQVGEYVIQPPTCTDLELYPIVVMSYDPKKKSIHGNSDVTSNIANQKGINFLLAMMLLSAQNTAFPKMLSKPGAIKQTITNAPGEIIIDNSGMGQLDGIKYMAVGNFNTVVLTLVEKFVEITQKFAGAQDVSMGDVPGANMAASAIMMLQKSAGISTDGIRKRFYRTIKDVGRIWEQFWKKKYNVPRSTAVEGEDGPEMMDIMGTDYQEMNFDLKIDIGAAGTYSESLAQSTLENLFNAGAIDLLTYLKYSPKSAMPFKDSLMKDIQRQQQEQAMLMDAQTQLLNQAVGDQMGQFLGGAPGGGQAPPSSINGMPVE